MHLSARTCQLGVIHNRTEKHGEEDVPAIDVPIVGFAINAEELNGLLVHPFAHRALFDTSKTPAEPVFNCFKPLALAEKFHGATVTLYLGMGRDPIVLNDAKLAKVKLDPATGGMVSADLTAQCVANLDDVPKLLAFQGHEIECAIDVDPTAKPVEAQKQLPIDDPDAENLEGGDDEGREGDDLARCTHGKLYTEACEACEAAEKAA